MPKPRAWLPMPEESLLSLNDMGDLPAWEIEGEIVELDSEEVF